MAMLGMLSAVQAIDGLVAIFEGPSALPGGAAHRVAGLAHANDLMGIGAESLRSRHGWAG
jgi:hypothetical protein